MGLGPEHILAHPPNDSIINPLIWRGGLRISLMCGPETTGCSPHISVRLELGTFAIVRTENLMDEAGLAKLDEIRKLNSTKSATRILTQAIRLVHIS
jgi:hypothetical protein